jgi:uncharacterized membrane protein YgcG
MFLILEEAVWCGDGVVMVWWCWCGGGMCGVCVVMVGDVVLCVVRCARWRCSAVCGCLCVARCAVVSVTPHTPPALDHHSGVVCAVVV